MEQEDKFIERMKVMGMPLPPQDVRIHIEDAETTLNKCFAYMLKRQNKIYAPQDEYKEVIKWLDNNEGKGLLLHGDCGRGKSFLARYVIPAIFLVKLDKIVQVCNATDMNQDIDNLKKKKILVIDDLGCEYMSNIYGQKRNAFDEIIDSAEQNGNLLIVTSNLSKDELMERYGERVVGRLVALTKRVFFKGESLRL